MSNLQQYLMSRNVQAIEDWSSYPLDDEGKALQVQMTNAIDVRLYSNPQVDSLTKSYRPCHYELRSSS